MSLIPLNKYSKILEDLPIYCVDIIIKNDKEEYLLIKRNNEPKKGEWWVVGGRVLKGETAKEAAIRKVKQETNTILLVLFLWQLRMIIRKLIWMTRVQTSNFQKNFQRILIYRLLMEWYEKGINFRGDRPRWQLFGRYSTW